MRSNYELALAYLNSQQSESDRNLLRQIYTEHIIDTTGPGIGLETMTNEDCAQALAEFYDGEELQFYRGNFDAILVDPEAYGYE